LKKELTAATGEGLKWLAVTLQKNRVDLPELTATVIKLANSDSQFRPVAVELFSGRAALPDDAIPLFVSVARAEDMPSALRTRALRSLTRSSRNAAAADGALAVAAAILSEKSQGDLNSAWEDFVRDTRHAQRVAQFRELAESGSAAERTVAYGVLTSLATGRVASRDAKAAANAAIDRAWGKMETVVPLLHAIGRMRNDAYALQVRGLADDGRAEVARAAKQSARQMGLDTKRTPGAQGLIESLPYEQVLGVVMAEKGEARRGRDVFTKAGCAACHTTAPDEAPKGPFLGDIATRYSRAELCESILKPTVKIAQGFETQWFKTREGEELEGFVTREGGDDLDVRNILGITTTLAKKDIAERGQRDSSMMPAGLLDKLTAADLAALLAYLESLKSK
jgi:putative heme-binding domain-containing protein